MSEATLAAANNRQAARIAQLEAEVARLTAAPSEEAIAAALRQIVAEVAQYADAASEVDLGAYEACANVRKLAMPVLARLTAEQAPAADRWQAGAEAMREACREAVIQALIKMPAHDEARVAAIAAIRALGIPSPPTSPAGWRPIESAPKDGTEIILWGRYWSDSQGWMKNPLIGQWDERLEQFEVWARVPFGIRPTVWQPVPSPPAEETP